MSSGSDRYNRIVNSQMPDPFPPITRLEAERAARRLFRVFGKKAKGAPHQRIDVRFRRVRTCWLSPKPTSGHFKGWGRLIHDIGHEIFRARCPGLRPHGGGHAYLEKELLDYVVQHGWLEGKLKPPAPIPLSPDHKRITKLWSIEQRLKTWHSKRIRAENAIRKLERQRKRLRLSRLVTNSEETQDKGSDA